MSEPHSPSPAPRNQWIAEGPALMHERIYFWQNAAKARVHHVVRRCLSQDRRNVIKRWQRSARKRMTVVLTLLHGTYSAKEIVDDLKTRIPRDAEILMVHSSYDRMLPMYKGTPQDLVNELIAFCGKDRTLVMPAFVLGGRLYDKKEYFRTHAFDVKRTPSEMGILTEVFRRTPGVMRSLHPTHSVCGIGPLAPALIATHHLASTRTGEGTPFGIMRQKPTAIVGLGIEYFRCVTQTHTAEDILGDEFPVKFQRTPIPVELVDWEGNRIRYNLVIPQASKMLDNTLLRSLLLEDELIEWTFRGTAMFVTVAGTVTERLIEAARKGITVYS
jgi:aminoglycoside 3-N-acetyltransferase